MHLRILQIEDVADDAALILRELHKGGYTTTALRVETAEELSAALDDGGWDLILSDYAMPRFSGLTALEMLKARELDIPFIVVSGAIGEETAVQLMRAGAMDFVGKEKLGRLVPVIRRELGDAEIRRQRRAAEAALQQALREEAAAKSRIDNILRSVPDGLLVCDRQQRVILINQVAAGLLRLDTSAAIGRPVDEVISDHVLRGRLQAPQEDEGPAIVFLELPRPDAEYPRVIHTRTSIMKDQNGVTTGTVTTLRDVTRERELDRLKNEFISVAAHELNTPLATVLGYLELLMQPDDYGGFTAEQQGEFLQVIHAKSLALASIVDELLDISRIESGHGLKLRKEACDLRRLITQGVEQFRRQSPRHTFELGLSAQMPERLSLDSAKINRVFENLLSNAIKYSPAGGTIRIATVVEGSTLVCTVADQGIGMSEAQTGKVFDKFYRVDASSTAVLGLGLGLSITKQIIESHAGRIWIESEPGKGTEVRFTLPL